MNVNPVASIIICTCNRAEHLTQTLASLRKVYVPDAIPSELIIVDNGSTDATKHTVDECRIVGVQVRYIYEASPGLSHARNTGIANARGKIILFTDDDVRFPQNWIEGMCRPICNGEASILAGGVVTAPHLRRSWMREMHHAVMASTEGFDGTNPGVVIGANMSFSKDVLTKVPGFDVELGAGTPRSSEDVFFAWQLQAAGYRISSALDVVVEHHFDEARMSRLEFLSRARCEGRKQAYLAHHWLHAQYHFVHIKLMWQIIRLVWMRTTRILDCIKPNGLPEWEMTLLQKVHFCKQYLIERKRPHNYDKHGLVKRVCH